MLPCTRESAVDQDHARPPAAGGGGPTSPLRNRLLAAFAPVDLEPLRPHLLGRPVHIAQDQVLHVRGEPVRDVFFPETGLVSLTVDTLDGGGSAEVAVTGREGLVGAAVLLDPEAIATHEAVVQIPGTAWRVPAQALCAAVERSPALRERLLRYVQFLMVQTGQAAACNARHSLSRRLARWLLMAHDRVDGDELALRQEAVSLMLGVRREGVNLAAHSLHDSGLIRQARGRITVIDRPGLEAATCGCYRAVRDGEARILGLDTD
jgi:CRP-like cAMP-binding protein